MENNWKGQGEAQKIRGTTKSIICLSGCLAVTLHQNVLVFLCFISASRGEVGGEETGGRVQ